jgi:hypothetical protein
MNYVKHVFDIRECLSLQIHSNESSECYKL